jgi:hypothetical protein
LRALEALHARLRDRTEDAVVVHADLALDRGDRRPDVAEAQELRPPPGRGGHRRGVERRRRGAVRGAGARLGAAGERRHHRRGEHRGAHRQGRPLAPLPVAAADAFEPPALAGARERLHPQVRGREVALAPRVRIELRRAVIHGVLLPSSVRAYEVS